VFQLLRTIHRQDLVVRQLPAFGSAFVIAGSFYQFHSFYLETVAFMVTWFVIDAALEGLRWTASRLASGPPR
jgi:hypothetical protein